MLLVPRIPPCQAWGRRALCRPMTNKRKFHKPAGKLQPSPAGTVWLFGSHAVDAALANPDRRHHRLLLTAEAEKTWRPPPGAPSPSVVERAEIDRLLPQGTVHQGIALLTGELPELGLEAIIATAPADAILVVLDQVTDPHNVGAILRSAAVFGAMAVVTQDRHAAAATGTLAKAASGALEQVPLVRVTNLARALRDLQEADFWVVGLEGSAERTVAQAQRAGRVALVLGAEGPGLRRLTMESCDDLGRLPTFGPMRSLNVSNAAAVGLYAIRAARGEA